MSTKTQWHALKRLGFSDNAAAAIMGNAEAESNCEPNRLQGDFSGARTASINYTSKVDSGEISRSDFIYKGPNGGGYGWLQWTYFSRKAGLYDKAKSLGKSIGSEDVAIAWLWEELHQGEFSNVLAVLYSNTSIRYMSDVFMKQFEKPADQGEKQCQIRAAYAQKFYDQFAGSPAPEPEPEPDPDPTTDTEIDEIIDGLIEYIRADIVRNQELLQFLQKLKNESNEREKEGGVK